MKLLQEGFLQQQAGKEDAARRSYTQVLRFEPKNAHALNLLGMLAVNQGRPIDAIKLIRLALEQDPSDHQAHANIGLAYRDSGDRASAARHLQQSLQIHPDDPVVLNNLGNVLRELDRPRDAVSCFERALGIDRDYAECWSNLAAAQTELCNYRKATIAADRALALNPRLPQAHHSHGNILRQLGQFSEALASYLKAVELAPDYAEALISKSDVERDLNQPETARRTLQQVLRLQPRNPFAHYALGVLAEQLGQREEAAMRFQEAIAIAPAYANAHYELAQLKDRDSSDEEIEAMERLWQDKGLLPTDRKMLGFALFRAWDARNQTTRAFPYLASANRIKALRSPYDDKHSRDLMQSITSGAEKLAATLCAGAGATTAFRPVFVLGMPRSGTTLTEQVLASHSQVVAAGEVSYAFDCARLAAKLSGEEFPACVSELSEEHVFQIGEHYLRQMEKHSGQLPVVIDKTPLNFQYIGLLALALPDALFLHCHRDPTDTCFSIHRIPFDEKQTYAHDLDSLGRYYRHYQALMARWRRMLPGRILDVRYEDTVADLETQSRTMLKFLNLSFEPAVLEYHRAQGLVKTPSASQVREPIYSGSIGGWRRYQEYLQPLLKALNS